MLGGAVAEKQRLDKWLWHVRLAPSRTRAAEFIRLGFVRLNGVRVTDPARNIRCGDVLTLALDRKTIVVRILSLLDGRVGAAAAENAYTTVGAE